MKKKELAHNEPKAIWFFTVRYKLLKINRCMLIIMHENVFSYIIDFSFTAPNYGGGYFYKYLLHLILS